ncbi:MAG: hypothetical protein ETSY1_17830 [Candidatus Entotheonella factor]|uniref:Uncharacterized protein n=1 Tax=Entotheonella factor TaxID=1429438 RepID=W4LLR4_ENTF1|nr:MAG: hypothetical protein ETSY1_17830 [Candidatus Entotheonella factor]
MVIYGDGNKVIGNVLDKTPIIVRNGNTTQDKATKKLSSGKYGHPAAHNTLVAANQVVDSYIGVGVRVPGGGNYSGFPAEDTELEGNLPQGIQDRIKEGEEKDTVKKGRYNGEVSPTVELTPADVGPKAPESASLTE